MRRARPRGTLPCCDAVDRGAAPHGDNDCCRTLDPRPAALDRKTGDRVRTCPMVDGHRGTVIREERTMTAARVATWPGGM